MILGGSLVDVQVGRRWRSTQVISCVCCTAQSAPGRCRLPLCMARFGLEARTRGPPSSFWSMKTPPASSRSAGWRNGRSVK
jgi:hypothetical protein